VRTSNFDEGSGQLRGEQATTMESAARGQADYALGHGEHELARLTHQGKAFLPFTRQLFEQAGLGAGMRVLDVGSGAGDVCFLVNELVGPTGKVIGIDRAEQAVQWSRQRARSMEMKNVEFLTCDANDFSSKEPFDAIVGRFVLMYCPNPVETIRTLARLLRPGGLIVFQEFDMRYVRSHPLAPTFERATAWMRETFRATGTQVQLGTDLYSVFVTAGLPDPCLRMDVLLGGGQNFPGYEILAGTIQSLLPVMEQLGIATTAEVNLPTLAKRMRDEVIAMNGIAFSPALIGGWSRKSDESQGRFGGKRGPADFDPGPSVLNCT
jgi:ubiquinone/menaquinone biosynthesis C-methylase UbiE